MSFLLPQASRYPEKLWQNICNTAYTPGNLWCVSYCREFTVVLIFNTVSSIPTEPRMNGFVYFSRMKVAGSATYLIIDDNVRIIVLIIQKMYIKEVNMLFVVWVQCDDGAPLQTFTAVNF